jgi:hypothetical protein
VARQAIISKQAPTRIRAPDQKEPPARKATAAAVAARILPQIRAYVKRKVRLISLV